MIELEMTVADVEAVVFPHPTVSEALKVAILELPDGSKLSMLKSIILESQELLAPGRIHCADIEVNVYNKTIEQERALFSQADLLAVWQDMAAIRQFETILNEIKIKRVYKGVNYDHLGPAHLSIGQEAAAVGDAVFVARLTTTFSVRIEATVRFSLRDFRRFAVWTTRRCSASCAGIWVGRFLRRWRRLTPVGEGACSEVPGFWGI